MLKLLLYLFQLDIACPFIAISIAIQPLIRCFRCLFKVQFHSKHPTLQVKSYDYLLTENNYCLTFFINPKSHNFYWLYHRNKNNGQNSSFSFYRWTYDWRLSDESTARRIAEPTDPNQRIQGPSHKISSVETNV